MTIDGEAKEVRTEHEVAKAYDDWRDGYHAYNSDIPTVLHVGGCTITVTTGHPASHLGGMTIIDVIPDEGWDVIGMPKTKVVKRSENIKTLKLDRSYGLGESGVPQ